MLDYAILQKNDASFIKKMELFDLRTAVEEIIAILSFKIDLKQIEIRTNFENFKNYKDEENYVVKTDSKRMQ